MAPDTSALFFGSALFALAVVLGFGPAMQALDRFNRNFTGDIRDRMRELALPTASLDLYLRWWWTLMVSVFLALWLLAGMLPVAVVAIVVMYSLVRPGLRIWAERRKMLLRNQLVGAARAMANQARAGVTLAQGLAAVARETADPLGAELRRTMAEYQQGTPLVQVLANLKDRLRFESMTLFVVAITVCHERGGNLSFALDQVCHSLEEQQRVERKLESDTASGHMLVCLMGIFPVAFMGLFYMLDPGGTALVFSSLFGQLILCVVAGIVYVSTRWAGAILTKRE